LPKALTVPLPFCLPVVTAADVRHHSSAYIPAVPRPVMLSQSPLVVLAAVALLAGCAGGGAVRDAQPLPGSGPTELATRGEVPSENLVPAVVGVPRNVDDGAIHRITPGDVIDIKVFQADELNTTVRVNDAGGISLPLVGMVLVAGLNTGEAERRIAAALAQDHLQDPQVAVFVSEFANLEVSIAGEVNKPGVFPIRGRTTLLEGIALAGGTTRRAKEEQVIVFRTGTSPAGVDAYVVDLKKIQQGELNDPMLAAEDKIVVPKSGSRVFFEDVRDTLRGFVNFNPLLY
jgi:polysaccharide biosynthesis/export protein